MSFKIHYFHPSKNSWQQKLTAIETFHCGMFPQGSFYFNGGIELNKFLHALQTTLEVFDFLFCKLYRIKDGVMAAYQRDNNHCVQLEIETFDKTLNELSALQTLPQHLDQRIRSGVTDNIDGLPIVTFKLTIASNGFVLGYCINHTFIDQASLVYFLKYLAHSYSDNVQSLKKPLLLNIEKFLNEDNSTMELTELVEFRNYAKKVGLKYIANLSDLHKKQETSSNTPVYLHLNTVKIDELKQEANQLISKNDIMHGLLLKLYAEDPALLGDYLMHFGFACNMRKYLGLEEETVGNILHFPYFDPIKVSDVRAFDIVELAEISRKNVNNISIAAYQNKITWFKQFYTFHEMANHYVPLPYVDSLYWGHTNWASFTYQDISFQGNRLLALWTPPFPSHLKFTVTLFDDRNTNCPLIIPINLTDLLLQKALNLAKSMGLFTVQLCFSQNNF